MVKALVGEGRGGDEIRKIAVKGAQTKARPLKCFKDGSYHATYVSIQDAARQLEVNPGGIDRCLKNKGNRIGGVYSFEFEKHEDIVGEIWKRLPTEVPDWMLARRKSDERRNWKPGKLWGRYQLSTP